MKRKSVGRAEDQLVSGIEQANVLIAGLCARDGVDTTQYGLMVRRAGGQSMALHRGLHPSEEAPSSASGSRDPRLPRAVVGLSVSGALKTDLKQEIEARHSELVRLHRWHHGLGGRTPLAADMRWDPVMLRLLRDHGVDLDAVVAGGAGEFCDPLAHRDHPSVPRVLLDPATDVQYVGCVDGDAVRALQVRYAPGVFYSWRRDRPAHVELSIRERSFPETVVHGLLGEPMSTVVGHSSLAEVPIESYAGVAGTHAFKSASRLVSI